MNVRQMNDGQMSVRLMSVGQKNARQINVGPIKDGQRMSKK